MKIIIGVPAYKRPNLLFVHTHYTNKYLKPALMQKGFEVTYMVVGSSNVEGDIIRKFDGIEYYEIPNVLSHKKNFIHNQAKIKDVDFLFWLDSDDFIPVSLLMKSIEVANQNGYWSSVTNMFTYDSHTQQMIHFDGYSSRNSLKNQGLGTCRTYTKQLLKKLPLDVYGYNKNSGMDGLMLPHLMQIPVAPQDRLITTPPERTLIGIKTSQNIWQIKDFNPAEISVLDLNLKNDTFSWLDLEIKDLILSIDTKNP